MRVAWCLWICSWVLVATGWDSTRAETDDCRKIAARIAAGDLEQVILVVSRGDNGGQGADLDIAGIKKNLISTLTRAGIAAGMAESEKDIGDKRYLKAHVYNITLERRVYFCSLAVVQQLRPAGEACILREYSNVTSQADQVNRQMQQLLGQLIGEVVTERPGRKSAF